MTVTDGKIMLTYDEAAEVLEKIEDREMPDSVYEYMYTNKLLCTDFYFRVLREAELMGANALRKMSRVDLLEEIKDVRFP